MSGTGANLAGLNRAGRPAAVLLVLVLAGADAVTAQDNTNEVWLGQVGGLNTLSILQEGRGNAAGADDVSLLLRQDGAENSLTLTQSGYNNALGTMFAAVSGHTRGIAQIGSRNAMIIEQRNRDVGGANTIGAIQQISASALPAASGAINILSITQTDEGGTDGVADHFAGRMLQIATTVSGEANQAALIQSGGGADAGNIFANLGQIGAGNDFAATQTGTRNRIGELPPSDGNSPTGGVFQYGTANAVALAQTGERNTVEYVEQYGRANALAFSVDGNRNVAVLVYQNNQSWGGFAIGNTILAAVSGSDNGGGGSGWIGELVATASLSMPGIAQGVLSQIGDANSIDLTIIQGLDARYGISQVGTGNQALVSFAAAIAGANATGNESALFQAGDDNDLSHTVSGSNSSAAIRIEGSRNLLRLTQAGSFNLTEATLFGNDNNAPGLVLSGSAGALAAMLDGGLGAGDIRQTGTGIAARDRNSIAIALTGDSNGFAVLQDGGQNTVTGTVDGSLNSLVVAQRQMGNTAIIGQSGVSNSLAMHQL